MISPRRFLLVGVSALTLMAAFCLSTGCQPKSHPAPFTARLTEIEGVQAVYMLRHPKLILGDLDKLMTEVPEAALLRMGLAQLTPYGYPEFSELAAGSNIGIALLELAPEDFSAGTPTLVAFAKLKEGGKIWTLLAQRGLVLQRHDEWTWIAQDVSAFAKIKAPAPLIAYIDQPQTEELRGWGRLTPALLGRAKDYVLPLLEAKLAARPAAEQKALLAYVNVLWGYLAQLHSAGGSLDFNDQGVTLVSSAQFLPESPAGTFLRYAPGPAPKIAQSVPGDALMSVAVRQNMTGQIEFVRTVLDSLIAVDYPAGAEPLRTAKASYLAFAGHSDGGAVLTMNMTLPKDGQAPAIDVLGVQSGHFTEAQVGAFYRDSLALSQKFTNATFAALSVMTPNAPLPELHQELTENALTIDGIHFGSIITTTKATVASHEQTTTTTQYYGVVGGNLVYAVNEAALREKIPAIAAKRLVSNPVDLMFKDDEVAVMALHGGKMVDMVAGAAQIDLTDADIQAQVTTLKQAYTAGGPVKIIIGASQAQGTVTLSIPYKFIAQSVRLGQFVSAYKAPAPGPLAAGPVAATMQP